MLFSVENKLYIIPLLMLNQPLSDLTTTPIPHQKYASDLKKKGLFKSVGPMRSSEYAQSQLLGT